MNRYRCYMAGHHIGFNIWATTIEVNAGQITFWGTDADIIAILDEGSTDKIMTGVECTEVAYQRPVEVKSEVLK